VIGSVQPDLFLRDFLAGFLESQLFAGRITTAEYHNRIAILRRDARVTAVGHRLFAISPKPVSLRSFGRLRLIYLREPGGNEFPFLQGMAKSASRESGKKLTCFVGHRFVEGIEQSLRFNLVHLFEPHQIALRWSGFDLSARDLFEEIVSGIRTADLCLFDNLGTLNRPNVYIEIGIAHTLGKPMLVCEYVGKGRKKRVPDTDSVPADLQGLLRITYQSYEDLSRKLYFGLPLFLERHRLL
jgi:hypothetical protein